MQSVHLCAEVGVDVVDLRQLLRVKLRLVLRQQRRYLRELFDELGYGLQRRRRLRGSRGHLCQLGLRVQLQDGLLVSAETLQGKRHVQRRELRVQRCAYAALRTHRDQLVQLV